jgi:hypothetical protein
VVTDGTEGVTEPTLRIIHLGFTPQVRSLSSSGGVPWYRNSILQVTRFVDLSLLRLRTSTRFFPRMALFPETVGNGSQGTPKTALWFHFDCPTTPTKWPLRPPTLICPLPPKPCRLTANLLSSAAAPRISRPLAERRPSGGVHTNHTLCVCLSRRHHHHHTLTSSIRESQLPGILESPNPNRALLGITTHLLLVYVNPSFLDSWSRRILIGSN